MITNKALLWGKTQLGQDNPEIEAELLLRHALGDIERVALFLRSSEPLTDEAWALYQSYIKRRVFDREPLAYILGSGDFMGLRFHVGPGVLIPRSDTETLFLEAEKFLQARGVGNFLDIGTGSGCLALSLLARNPSLSGEAWDVCEKAIGIAKKNQDDLEIPDTQFRLIKRDLTDPSSWGKQIFDLILSNPPYIGEEEKLPPDVILWEPHGALFAPNRGLLCYEKIAQYGKASLKEGGQLMVEVGSRQAREVSQIFLDQGFTLLKIQKDLGGRERVVVLGL